MKFREYLNEAKTIKLKSLGSKSLEIKELEKPDSKGNWLVILSDGEIDFYFNRNSWWEIPVGKGAGSRTDHKYGKYETKKPLDFKDQQAINKLVGLNLV